MALIAWGCAGIGLYRYGSGQVSFCLYQLFCIGACFALRKKIAPLSEPYLPSFAWPTAIAGSIIVCVSTWFVSPHMGWLFEPSRIRTTLAAVGLGISAASLRKLVIGLVLLNPIVEEHFWRRNLFLGFRSAGWTLRRSAITSGALFGAMHWLVLRLLFSPLNAVLITLVIAIFGCFLAIIYNRCGALPLVIFIHAFAGDAAALLALHALWVA
jgi:membrane protease YdiL (CAAX protease family)